MNQIIFHFCILIGFGVPAAGFLWSGNPIHAALFNPGRICLGNLERRGPVWGASIALLIGVLGIAYGNWTSMDPLVSISSVICLLMAWNLTQFHRFTRQAALDDDLTKVEMQHFTKTLALGLITLVVSFASINIQIRVSFIQAVLLLVLAIIGMMQLVRWLKFKSVSLEE